MSEEHPKKRYKVLMSAYACEPHKGSEPGVGWNWALAYRDIADLWVMTRANNRDVIEAWEREHGETGIHWVWVDAEPWMLRIKKRIGGAGIRLYYWLWQWHAAKRALLTEKTDGPFDWVHQLTMNGFREPGRLDRMVAPVAWGPIGGLQNAELKLARLRGCKPALMEGLRTIANLITKYCGWRSIRAVRRRALVIGANNEAMHWIRFWRPEHHPSMQLLEIGAPSVLNAEDTEPRHRHKILWVGSDDNRKNPEFALLVIDRLHKQGHALLLTMVGLSSCRQNELRRWAGPRNISLDAVTMVDRVDHEGLSQYYKQAGQFWFTSYRDTSGNVLLEALAHGSPCIAFNHQGAAVILGEGRGFLIEGRSVQERVDLWSRVAMRILRAEVTIPKQKSPFASDDLEWSRKPPAVARKMTKYDEGMDGKHSLMRCASWLQLHGYRFVTVGDIRGFPNKIRGDVDIAMSHSDLQRFRRDVFRMAAECRLRVVQCFRHESCAFYFVLVDIAKPSAPYLRLDVCSDYLRASRRLMLASDLLKGAQCDTLNIPPSGLPIPGDCTAFQYYLIKKVDKKHLDPEAFDYLRLMWGRLSEAQREDALGPWWGLSSCSAITDVLNRADFEGLRSLLPQLSVELRRRSRPLFGDIFREAVRRFSRVLHPTGLTVVILGPDGSGKSALIERLETTLLPAFRKVERLHFRPFFGRSALEESYSPVTDPHNQVPRSTAGSLIKLGYYTMDYAVGMARLYFRCRVRSTLVLFDRYAYDLPIDPKRYRYGGPRWGTRLFSMLVPKPDLVLVLSGDPEVIWQRKKEVSRDETARLCSEYDRVAKREDWHVLDAACPLESVAKQAEQIVLMQLEQRLKRRVSRRTWPFRKSRRSSTFCHRG